MTEAVFSISPQQINYILTLAQERSFQRASEKCYVTQPTLSMQVKKAEELIGHLLFDRSKHPLELTPAGEKLLPKIQEIQQLYYQLQGHIKSLDGQVNEEIRIGIIPTIASYLIPEIIENNSLLSAHTRFSFIELQTHRLIEALESNQLDVAVFAGPYQNERFQQAVLFHEEIKIYAAINKETIELEDLKHMHPWLLSPGNCLRTQMMHFCDLEDDTKNEQSWEYEGSSMDILIRLVNLHGGYTLVPEFAMPENKHLRSLTDPKTLRNPAREVIAVYSKKSHKQTAIHQLIHSVQHVYGQRSNDYIVLPWK